MADERYLLDTHALVWWWLDDPALSRNARAALEATSNRILVSAVSAIEIALKVRMDKLPAMKVPLGRFDTAVMGDGFSHIAVDHRHAIRAGLLEGEHRDPFDRLIAAQALIEDLVVVTRDPAIAGFGCRTLW